MEWLEWMVGLAPGSANCRWSRLKHQKPERTEKSKSLMTGGEAGTVSDVVLDHRDYNENTSRGEARQSIGRCFLEKG